MSKQDKHEFLQDNLRVFVVPTEILDVPDLTIYEKMAYIVIRSHANARQATAFPSYSTIAREGSMSRRKAIDAVQSLTEKGLLKKELRLDVSKNRKIRNTSNLYTLQSPSQHTKRKIVHDMHHPSASDAPPLVHDMHHPSASDAPKNNQLKESVRKESLKNSQSVETSLPDVIKKVVEQNGLTDRLSPISKVYESVKDTTGYSDALFIQTLLKSATLKEAHTKQKNNLAFERYIRKAILTNISEATAQHAISGTGKKAGLIEDKLPASVQKQLEREAQGITTTDEKKTLKDYPELQQMLDELRNKNEA